MGAKPADLTGQVFGRLRAIKPDGRDASGHRAMIDEALRE